MYYIEHYRAMNKKVTDYSKHLDFVVALGAALGGGSGLGILGSTWMAVPCGIITAASVIVGAAKQAYNWPEKSKFCSDMMLRNFAISSECRRLFEDLQVAKLWDPAFEASFLEIRKKLDELPIDQMPELSSSIRSQIQQDIVRREEPQKWWKPSPAQNNNTTSN
jgi:hypothetical protein